MSRSLRFPNYLEMRERLPLRAWQSIRAAVLLVFLGSTAALALTLSPPELLWSVLVPIAPLIFFLAPGIWRNICPLATLNQLPRLFGFSRNWDVPTWAADAAYNVAVLGFYVLVFMRKLVFEHDAMASAVLLGSAAGFAFIGGALFAGKSGWCGTFCPMAPVEKLYGQNPYVLVPNNHCSPCVGCNTNCFDFNPRVAYFADVSELDERHARYRRFFAAAFPGFILGYYQLDVSALGPVNTALAWAGQMMVSVGIFALLETVLQWSVITLTTTFAMAALNIYYWFAIGPWFETLGIHGLEVPATTIANVELYSRIALAGLSVHWIWRTKRNEREYADPVQERSERDLSDEALDFLADSTSAQIEVNFLPEGKTCLTQRNRSISAIATDQGSKLKVGCLAGICGVDPVTIVEGQEHVAKPGDLELETLSRLGVSDRCRMACMATLTGPVTVRLEPEYAEEDSPITAFDPSIRCVVIIGAGIGGVTAADYIRKNHPDCAIHLISNEQYDFYNRISIAKLIEDKAPIESLFVKDPEWYEKAKITRLCGVEAQSIDVERKLVSSSDGQNLSFDRLILATGCRARMPSTFDSSAPGLFGFRDAGDASAIRDYIESFDVREISVVGDGVSGVELAHSLCRMGLRVHLLGRNARLMQRNLDERASQLLANYLEGYGVKIVPHVDIENVTDGEKYKTITFDNGGTLLTEMIIFCTGNLPNTELARAAGLEVGHGIIVDDHMRTSAEGVYAVGDAAEVDGITGGLWTTSSEQGRIAALNALGGDERYVPRTGKVGVKVPGIDVMSAGDFESSQGVTFSILDEDMKRYARLVIDDGKIIGAITVNHREEHPFLAKAVTQAVDVSGRLDPLLTNDLNGFARALMETRGDAGAAQN